MKRIVRSPWLWIPVAVVGVLLALQYLVPNGGYNEIDTSKMVDHINSGRGQGDHLRRRRRPADPGRRSTTARRSWRPG